MIADFIYLFCIGWCNTWGWYTGNWRAYCGW